MKKYLIERNIPGVGSLDGKTYQQVADKSNQALAQLGEENIKWEFSYVAADQTVCVYYAKNVDYIKKHAELSGFPADRIIEVKREISPATAEGEEKKTTIYA